ncbi:hypothetical protein FRC02_010187 [Tulasnella sp. 418]|nr:hypothetical protein FRC02_010187 [Tulasnella sp. 418]
MPVELPAYLIQSLRNPVVAVGIPIALGSLNGYPTRNVVRGYWYNSLYEPAYTPPRAAFGIVWPILYAGMGFASHLAVNAFDNSPSLTMREGAYTGIKLYYGQLALNLLWTPLFFLLRKKGLALLDITALTAAVFYTTKKLHGPTDGKSTYLLAPYCAWLCYATYLNAGYWWLNRGRKDLDKLE